MDNENKKTAIQGEQQLNEKQSVLEEFHKLNKTLKDISDTLTYVLQYGIITKS